MRNRFPRKRSYETGRLGNPRPVVRQAPKRKPAGREGGGLDEASGSPPALTTTAVRGMGTRGRGGSVRELHRTQEATLWVWNGWTSTVG
ncbi:hypothetical protein SRHO_G00346290 [Serrasalmus rhombeus]